MEVCAMKWSAGIGRPRERRRSLNLLQQPGIQLKLPAYLLLVTVGFGALWTRNAATAFADFYQTLSAHQPSYLVPMLTDQLRDFAIFSGIVSIAYVLALLVICIVYLHRLVGPSVALRRQLESLKNGDYSRRVRLRRNDAFQDLAADLNELADLLERKENPS
jgi:methyl-accepting chemotaxis protein